MDTNEAEDTGDLMSLKSELYARVDNEGRLVLPQDVVTRYGLKPDARVYIDEKSNTLRLRQPVTHLGKVYIEPTNICNLECRTCIRNVWDDPLGRMSNAIFDRIVEGLRGFLLRPLSFSAALESRWLTRTLSGWWPE